MTTAALRTRSARRAATAAKRREDATLAGQRGSHRHGYRRSTAEPQRDGDHRRSVSAHDRCRRTPRREGPVRTALIAWSTRSSVGRRWGSRPRPWRWPVSIGSSISATSPGKQAELVQKAVRKAARFWIYAMRSAGRSASKLLHRTAAAGSAVSQRSLAAAAVQPHLSVVSAHAAVVVQRHDRSPRRLVSKREDRRIHQPSAARPRRAQQLPADQSGCAAKDR